MLQLKVCPKHYCLSTVGVREDLFRRDPKTVPVTDFFGSLRPVELTTNIIEIEDFSLSNKTVSKDDTGKKYRLVPQFPNGAQYS